MDVFSFDFFEAGSKKISFPEKEYLSVYKEKPEGFEISMAAAQALGCFCFCIAASEIYNNSRIKPSFRNPEADFIYVLSDFEKNYIKTLSQVGKNKLFSKKEYDINFENENFISGKAILTFNFIGKNSIRINIKLIGDFVNHIMDFNSDAVKNMNILFNSVWSKLFPRINKPQKAYSQKNVYFVPDYLKFATAPYIQELRRLMITNKDNLSLAGGQIIAEKSSKAGYYIFKHCFDNVNTLSKLEKMNDLTVDVLNCVVHLMLEKSKSSDMEVLLSVDDLLFIRGKRQSKNQRGSRGGYKESQRQEIMEHLEILSNLKVNVSNACIPVINNDGKRSYESYTAESPLIYLKKTENRDYCYYIKPGEVLALTLLGTATKTGIIHRKVAEYDHYRNYWEKRLGNYLAWIWRSRQNKAEFLAPITVEILLNQIGEEYKNMKLKRPHAIRDRFEKALYTLENDGVIRSWQYESIDETVLKCKNWFNIWLDLKMVIEPPVEIIEQYSKIKKIKEKRAVEFDFNEIIKIIKTKNISQLRISEETGINKGILSGILSGKILPNLNEKRKIRNWADRNKGL